LEPQPLLLEIEKRREREISRLEAEFRGEEAKLREAVRSQAEKIIEEAKREVSEKAERERVRILGSAELQAKRVIMDAYQRLIVNTMEALKTLLSEYSESRDYVELLSAMAEKARTRLGEKLVVRCRKGDRKFFEKAGFLVADQPLDTLGGAVFSTGDGRLELNLTFEELIRFSEGRLKARILSELGKV